MGTAWKDERAAMEFGWDCSESNCCKGERCGTSGPSNRIAGDCNWYCPENHRAAQRVMKASLVLYRQNGRLARVRADVYRRIGDGSQGGAAYGDSTNGEKIFCSLRICY